MFGYRPKICKDCLVFDHCSRSKKQRVACKRNQESQSSPPKTLPKPPKAGTTPSPKKCDCKQRTVLSVRDFAILYNLTNDKILHMESQARWTYEGYFYPNIDKEKQSKNIEESVQRLKEDSHYQDLLRIRDKLGELNI